MTAYRAYTKARLPGQCIIAHGKPWGEHRYAFANPGFWDGDDVEVVDLDNLPDTDGYGHGPFMAWLLENNDKWTVVAPHVDMAKGFADRIIKVAKSAELARAAVAGGQDDLFD